MDFIIGLPRTRSGYDSIWVIVDRLTKVAHFVPVKTTYTSAKLADIYMKRIVCLHGVPKKIVSDRGTQFTSHFWKQLHESLGTRLEFSTAFHPQTDGQTERVNQILEDMLRACALDYKPDGQQRSVARISAQTSRVRTRASAQPFSPFICLADRLVPPDSVTRVCARALD